jgi:hypothetical protein
MLFTHIRVGILAIALSATQAVEGETSPQSPSDHGHKKAASKTFAESRDVRSEELAEVKAELAKRMTEDQAVRTDAKKKQRMAKVDMDNTAYLKRLIDTFGWIDASRFGVEAAQAAFCIVQHGGDLPLMLAALPEIERDVKGKVLPGEEFAMLYDRTQVMQGKKQKYGTQITGQSKTGSMPDTLVVSSLENREKVDEYRKELGMPSLATYLDMLKKAYGIQKAIEIEE